MNFEGDSISICGEAITKSFISFLQSRVVFPSLSSFALKL